MNEAPVIYFHDKVNIDTAIILSPPSKNKQTNISKLHCKIEERRAHYLLSVIQEEVRMDDDWKDTALIFAMSQI